MSTSYDPNPPAPEHEGDTGPRHYDLSSAAEPDNGAVEPSSLSTLEQLRTAAEQAEHYAEIEFADCELFSPGAVIRLTCSTELDNSEWKKIQLGALPPEQRKKPRPDLRKLDEAAALGRLIAKQTTSVAIRQPDETYKVIEDRDGNVLTFADAQLMATLGAADPVVAIRKIFGESDAYVLTNGKELLDACGYGDRRPGEDDELDPR